MAAKDNSLIVIEPVLGKALPAVSAGSGLLPLIQALNPLGEIGKAIVEFLAYRTEVKRLQVERERIKEQARVIDRYIQAQLEAKLQELELRRQAMLVAVNHVQATLYERATTKDALIRSLDNANRAMSRLIGREDLPPAELLAVYRDTIAKLSDCLVQVDSHSVAQATSLGTELRLIVSDVRFELENTPPLNSLPPPSR